MAATGLNKLMKSKRSVVVRSTDDDLEAEAPLSNYVEPLDTRALGMMRDNKMVQLKGVRKEFPGGCFGTTKVAVDNIDVVFPEGSITILLGHNGAGSCGSCEREAASSVCVCVCVRFCVPSSHSSPRRRG